MAELSLKYIKEKWLHVGFQRYFRNTGWMFASRILCMVMAFITTALITAFNPGQSPPPVNTPSFIFNLRTNIYLINPLNQFKVSKLC